MAINEGCWTHHLPDIIPYNTPVTSTRPLTRLEVWLPILELKNGEHEKCFVNKFNLIYFDFSNQISMRYTILFINSSFETVYWIYPLGYVLW